MEIEKYELRKMLKDAAAEGARLVISQLKNPKIKEFVSERTAFEMLTKAGVTGAILSSWVNQGKIKFHRSGVSKNSTKKFYRVDVESLIEDYNHGRRS